MTENDLLEFIREAAEEKYRKPAQGISVAEYAEAQGISKYHASDILRGLQRAGKLKRTLMTWRGVDGRPCTGYIYEKVV